MKAYTSTTGIIFGLITLAHVFRIILENHALAKDPIYVLLTVLTTALSIWAWRLVRIRATGVRFQPELRSRKKGRVAPGLVGIGIDA